MKDYPQGYIPNVHQLDALLKRYCLWTNEYTDAKLVERLFRLFDVDRDNKISFADFLIVSSILQNGTTRDKMKRTYN
ncbi:unnamed protein product [Didymodactylos carnosus]|uniref:EF-hand domain-containing protein n=1 Tax=Didymodactylos carnosus TaxID=1234261 RepID=A0A813XIK3_9BILA|nr:unnamed protein product [Didymodactylos carnosus]CAF0876678.1 unnamed protein product [Didymodactylos carnosus]CAF3542073.1 unnamed protein product [Didymodactylos carnosus]CAF3663467.1 unnamed protein product [Didymodactylos carnosus]